MRGKDCVFVIAGGAPDCSYTKKIKDRISKLSNVIPIYGFVPNDEMAGFLKLCDVVMIPHSLSSSLNSGTVLLAFSYCRSAICSMIGTVKDIKDKTLFMGYEYRNRDEERNNFISQVGKFYEKYYGNREALDDLNMRVYNYVKEYHTKDILVKRYKEILED
jgi:glycosyltransferase involved in cell wall biosynthesis